MAETATAPAKKEDNRSRRTLRTEGRRKRKERIKTDSEFAKKLFEEKSKRSAAKKVAFRKRHAKA